LRPSRLLIYHKPLPFPIVRSYITLAAGKEYLNSLPLTPHPLVVTERLLVVWLHIYAATPPNQTQRCTYFKWLF